MKQSHQEGVKFLADAIKSCSHETVRIDDVPSLRDQLTGLKHTGAQFQQMLSTNLNDSSERKYKYQEKEGLNI